VLIGIKCREGSVLRKARSVRRFAFVLMLLFAAASQCSASVTIAESSGDEATSALAIAEEAVVSAYQAVLGAEEAGANVTDLLVRLNEAGELLTRARTAYNVGDFDSALNLAVQSRQKLNGFISEADALEEAAISERYLDFLINVVGSIVGTVAVAFVGFVSWFFLKRKYEKTGSAA